MTVKIIIEGETSSEVAQDLLDMASKIRPESPGVILKETVESDESNGGGEVLNTTPVDDVPDTATPDSVLELDVRGIPWDVRIHAKTKTKKQDGSWKLGRNLDPEFVASVEAELKQITDAPAVNVQTPTVPAPPAETVTTPAPPAPVVAGDPSPTPDTPADFGSLLCELEKIQVPSEKRDEVAKLVGLPGAMNLAIRPDLIPAYWQKLHEVL